MAGNHQHAPPERYVETPPRPATGWEHMRPLVPKGYVCYKTDRPIRVDGRLVDPAWEAAPWTDAFVDIEGDRRPAPPFETRAKMLWDDDFFYVAARMEEPHVWGALTEHNARIYHDNDFEVFIDPDGDNHHYYEFEVNALNTIWELTLEQPYKDGGGPAYFGTNLRDLKSAVHVEGTLNAPHDEDTAWTVEVAIPWKGLAAYSPRSVPPRHGEQWRVNFSRVQWQHTIEGNTYRKVEGVAEDNWVWSPQGVIDMHRPERWGYVQFSTAAPGTDAFMPDPLLPARDLLMEAYYRQRRYEENNGRWAATFEALELSPETQADSSARLTDLHGTAGGFQATARWPGPDGSEAVLHVDQHARLRIADPRE